MVTVVRDFLISTSGGPLAPKVLDDARVMRHRSGQGLAQIRMLNDMAGFELGLERTELVRQAEALQEIAVGVAVVAWHSLDIIYGQIDGACPPADWRGFQNDSLQPLEIIQLGLGRIERVGFAEGRYRAAKRERGIAEEVERLLSHLKQERPV